LDCKLGYPENEPGSVPHLPPVRRPVVPDTAKGVLNSNFRCGSKAILLRWDFGRKALKADAGLGQALSRF
jgi:hypothetical protein